MKRILSLFLVIGLLLSASFAHAETVREQVNAPERMEANLSSNTGKTTITVDAPIHVPDTASLYIIPVTNRAPSTEELKRFAEAYWPGINLDVHFLEIPGDGNSSYAESISMIDDASAIRVDINESWMALPSMNGIANAGLSAITWHEDPSTVNYNCVCFERCVENEQIEGHPLSSADAIRITSERMKKITDEPFELFATGAFPGILLDDDLLAKGEASIGTGYSYSVLFARKVDGVFILPSFGYDMQVADRDDIFTPPIGYEQVVMSVDRDGSIPSCTWLAPYVVSEERTECSLLPWQSIADIAKEILPLKNQIYEINGDIDIQIDRIELGYMALLQRDQTMTFALTPVWCFYGTQSTSAFYTVKLTVNAIDGTVVDLTYGY